MRTYEIKKQLDWIDVFRVKANTEEEALEKFNNYLEDMNGCFEDTEEITIIDEGSGVQDINGEEIWVENIFNEKGKKIFEDGTLL